MRKIPRIFKAAFIGALSALTLASCGQGETTQVEPMLTVNIDSGIYEKEEYIGEEDMALTNHQCKAGKEYFMAIFVDFSSNVDTSRKTVDAILKVKNINSLGGSIYDASSANTEQEASMTFQDSTEEVSTLQTTITFKIPNNANTTKQMKIIFRLVPQFEMGSAKDETKCTISFDLQPDKSFDYTEDGFTRSIYITQQQLDVVEPSWNQLEHSLEWTHVANAGAYKVKVGNTVVATITPNGQVEGDAQATVSSFKPNENIVFNMNDYPKGDYSVRVEAVPMPTNNNYIGSITDYYRFAVN